jgi:GH15 family glucan-1,4-alpha-glucosidase
MTDDVRSPPSDADHRWERRQPPIADYGLLSDCHSAALINCGGSIDWWCVPRYDSPSVFGRLLDPEAGHWSIRPVDVVEATERGYVGDTLGLRTTFRTARGEVAVTDAAALQAGTCGHDIGLHVPHLLIRRVHGVSGSVAIEVEFAPRVEYGRTQPHLRVDADGAVARGGPVRLDLTSPVPLRVEGGAVLARFVVSAGEVVEFRLRYQPAFAAPGGLDGDEATLEDTQASWQSWADLHDGYEGRFPAEVRRSSLVLQGLTYQPSGAVIAAATTSLPESHGR